MKIFLSIIVTMFLLTGCFSENQTLETPQQNNQQSMGEDSENSNTVVEHILDDSFKESQNNDSDEIVIRDKFFIAQSNDIYLNTEDYTDKIIRWEGIYTESTNPVSKETYKFVIRYGPGCCGYDGTAGFEILYDEDPPNLNDWVEAVGKIEMIEENGEEFVAIRISDLNVLDVRGQETVLN